jgi:hypothetical protein
VLDNTSAMMYRFPGILRDIDKNGCDGWFVVDQGAKFGATPVRAKRQHGG